MWDAEGELMMMRMEEFQATETKQLWKSLDRCSICLQQSSTLDSPLC